MAYTDQATCAQDSTFVNRVSVAVMVQAQGMALQTIDQAPDRTTWLARKALASKVFSDPRGWGSQFAWAVQSDSTVAAGAATPSSITDAQILTAVQAVWDSVANTAS